MPIFFVYLFFNRIQFGLVYSFTKITLIALPLRREFDLWLSHALPTTQDEDMMEEDYQMKSTHTTPKEDCVCAH